MAKSKPDSVRYEAQRMRDDGVPVTRIARRLKVTPGTLYVWWRNGVKPPKARKARRQPQQPLPLLEAFARGIRRGLDA